MQSSAIADVPLMSDQVPPPKPINFGQAPKYALFFAAFLLLIFIRRSAQLLHPQVWDEDGLNLLPEAIGHGIGSLLHPVSGYLTLIPRLICLVALRVSFLYFATVSTMIAWLFTASVCLAITFCPTWLRGRAVLGFCALLVPSNPECVGVPLYTFWWASLLLFLVVLWQNESRDLLLRTSFLLLAGLSTPVILLIPPLLLVRFVTMDHRRQNGFLLVVSVVCAWVQYQSIREFEAAPPQLHSVRELMQVIPCFFGNYVIGNLSRDRVFLWIAGSIVSAFILVGMRWGMKRPLLPFLLFLCLCSMLLTAVRVPLELISPAAAGPRYFFLPFILISWILVSLCVTRGHPLFRFGAAFLLLLAFANAFPVLSRNHRNLHWCEHVATAVHFPEYAIPIQYDGFGDAWEMKITGPEAKALLAADWLGTARQISRMRTFPFSEMQLHTDHPTEFPPGISYATTTAIEGAAAPLNDSKVPALAGFRAFGSRPHGDPDRQPITLHLSRGDSFLYCSGPVAYRQHLRIHNAPANFWTDLPESTHWSVLQFTSDQLPARFTVTLSDQGRNRQEWFAIALKTADK